MRAAAYRANRVDDSVGIEPAGSTDCGLTSAAMEKPLATKTLIAVTSEASHTTFVVVIDQLPKRAAFGVDRYRRPVAEDPSHLQSFRLYRADGKSCIG